LKPISGTLRYPSRPNLPLDPMSRLFFSFILIVSFIGSAKGQAPELADREQRNLALTDVISLVLNRNLSLERSKVQMELRENDVVFEEADKQANLTGSVGGTVRYFGDGRNDAWDNVDHSRALSGSLNSSLVLYNGGARAASYNQAQVSLEASIKDYDRNRQFVLFQSIFRYLEAILRLKEIEIQSEELASRLENLERIQVSYENQIRIKADVLRQQALVSDSERRLALARQTHQRSLYFLKELLVLPPETEILFDLENSGWGNEEFLPEPDLEGSWNRIIQRPDILAQEYRMEAADEGITIARSGKKPTVTASANLRTSYSSQYPFGSVTTQYFRTQPELSGGLSVNIPIFDRRRTSTNVARATLLRRQEEIDMTDLKQAARTDLLQAVLDFNTAKAQLQFSQQQLYSADAALEAEQARFDAGAATLLDVNSLRSTRLDAAVAVEEAWFELFTNRLDISFQDGTIEKFLIEQLNTQVPELR
jgi:outer membrane protein